MKQEELTGIRKSLSEMSESEGPTLLERGIRLDVDTVVAP
jgi:hypothetical protein